MSFLCEWNPFGDQPAEETRKILADGHRIKIRFGCPNPAAIILGADGEWRLCASCAERQRFRRFRVASVISTRDALRRDLSGWWLDDGTLVPPAPLAEVLARCALPRCPVHGWRPRLAHLDLGRRGYLCPEPGCETVGPAAETLEEAAFNWLRRVQVVARRRVVEALG